LEGQQQALKGVRSQQLFLSMQRRFQSEASHGSLVMEAPPVSKHSSERTGGVQLERAIEGVKEEGGGTSAGVVNAEKEYSGKGLQAFHRN